HLPVAYAILDSEIPHAIVRSELLQLLPPPDLNFFFTTILEQSRIGARVVSSLPPSDARLLAPAILLASGLLDDCPEAAALAQKIRSGVDGARLASWADWLRDLAHHPVTGLALGERFARGVRETAHRVGLVAAGELRIAVRVLPRLEDSLRKPPAAGKLEEVD